jgi:hypothetical protein
MLCIFFNASIKWTPSSIVGWLLVKFMQFRITVTNGNGVYSEVGTKINLKNVCMIFYFVCVQKTSKFQTCKTSLWYFCGCDEANFLLGRKNRCLGCLKIHYMIHAGEAYLAGNKECTHNLIGKFMKKATW